MAQRTRKERKETEGKKAKSRRAKRTRLPYGKKNYLFMGIGFILAVLGFVFLAAGDTIFSTILLTIGYVVLIPIGLYLEPKS
ncbi:MAG: hypothetical protein J7K11_07985 [Candidatus Hydrothermae bacterium]|nr:hypothetical protein [Candidatus Hydrothermae bacterium]RKZ00687.1 MAG: hypothetical protein DRQ04_05890 [Candidatus Hydrothermae bacterium]